MLQFTSEVLECKEKLGALPSFEPKKEGQFIQDSLRIKILSKFIKEIKIIS